jgi:hypothetical protein
MRSIRNVVLFELGLIHVGGVQRLAELQLAHPVTVERALVRVHHWQIGQDWVARQLVSHGCEVHQGFV